MVDVVGWSVVVVVTVTDETSAVVVGMEVDIVGVFATVGAVAHATASTPSIATTPARALLTPRSVPIPWQNASMEKYEPSTYGDRIADIYDDLYGDMDPSAAVTLLNELAGQGRVLELAIGTGRVAVPLAQKGIDVSGIDASEAMVERLRAKSETIPVTLGDFADVDAEGSFSLVYIVFNTFFGLLTQEDQIRCFENVATHLEPGGRFVIEAFVPDLSRFDRGQRVSVSDIGTDWVKLDLSIHDVANQRVNSQHLIVKGDSITLYPVWVRYAYPPELDLMAKTAGLELEHRWGGWDRSPFTSSSTSHVSVYRR